MHKGERVNMAKETVPVAQLREKSTKALLSLGVAPEEAETVVDSLLDAEIRGVASHGMIRLPAYADRIKKGIINVRPNIRLNRTGSVLTVDGDNGLGQVVTFSALKKCMEIADETGSACALIKNSNHFGTAGFYSRLAAEKGYIALVASNASANMPPFGGIQPMLGTNPFAVSFPAGRYDNFTIDIAMSAVAKGKIRIYASEGREIPIGWAMDAEGNDTTDPEKAIAGGLLPMGGHKGYGLAMVVDMLCGVLGGAKLSYESESMFSAGAVAGTGHFIWLLRIESIMPIEAFTARVEDWFERIKNTPTRPGVPEILIPGELENRKAAEGAAELQVSEKIMAEINDLLEGA